MHLAMWLAASVGEDFFNDPTRLFGPGRDYRLATEEEYRALGEDPFASDTPVIVTRVGDGSFFEVDVDFHVTPTSAESRRQWRELAARYAKRAARKKG